MDYRKYLWLPMVSIMGLAPLSMASTEQGASRLAKIVVTGELLSRTADETGSSVVILEEETLARRSDLRTVRDVLQEIPNITDVTGTGKAPTIRGVDATGPAENANAFFAGSRQRLNWQIDGRSASYNEVVFGDLGIWDLQSIEVFRGPQSTLVGRNAIAGTIQVKTNDPKAVREAAVRIEGGNYDQKRLSLMYNQPLSDSFSVRLAADGLKRQSVTEYDHVEGVGNPADIEGHTLRGKLLYEPKDERATRFLLTVSDVNYQGPNGEIIVRPFNQRRSNFPQQPVHNPHSTSASIAFSRFLTDALEFELDASVTDFTFKRKTDDAGSRAQVDTDEYVIEPRLRYNSDTGNQWVVGTRLYQSSQNEWINFMGTQRFKDEADAYSIYSEGLIPFANNYELILGLRYEVEDRTRDGGEPTGEIADIHADNNYDALLPKLGLNYKPNEDQTLGILYSRGFNSGGGGITFSLPIVNYEYSEEYVDSFEIYGRQNWLKGKLRTTQNVFYSLYKDMQLPFDLTPEDSRDEAFVVRNADGVRIQGVELGLTWKLDEQWNIFGNASFLDTKITDYPNSGLADNSLFMAPSAALQLGTTWTWAAWEATLSGHFTNGYYTSITNNPEGKVDAYGTLSANVSYQFNEGIKLYIAARNLLDEDRPIALYPGTAPNGSAQPDSDFDTGVLMQPRTITAGVQLSF